MQDIESWQIQEANLKGYEERLRKQQTQLEADKLLLQKRSAAAPAAAAAGEEKLRSGWDQLNKATAALESERKNFESELLALQEQERMLKQQEDRIRAQAAKLEVDQKKFQDMLAQLADGDAAPSTSGEQKSVKGIFKFGKK
jgi:chromosome segregation ATPase